MLAFSVKVSDTIIISLTKDRKMETENYKIDFVARTKEILEEDYSHFEGKGREVTFLLNCLLGLVVTISENEKENQQVFQGKIDDDFLELIPDKIGFYLNPEQVNPEQESCILIDVSSVECRVRVGHKKELRKKTKLWLINRIRNGIAHQNIEGISKEGQWTGVCLWNIDKKSRKDFEIIFTIDELKNFAIGLSSRYLNEIQSKQPNQ